MYDSDLTDAQWNAISQFFIKKSGQHLVKHDKKVLLNACFYVLKTGCQWRQMPNDFPNWKTVYSFFSRLKNSGFWEELSTKVTEISREKDGKKKLQIMPLSIVKAVKQIIAVKQKALMETRK